MSKSEDIKALYKASVMPTYSPEIAIAEGQGCKVKNPEGSTFYDFTSGIGVHNAGHCHPKVVRAIQAQAAKLTHCSNLFMNAPQAQLARKLVSLAGFKGGKAFFCNSGAEANEAAIKLARRRGSASGRYEVVTMRNSFHGRTLATVAATGQSWCQEGYDPLPVGFKYADFNDLESVRAAVTDKTAAVMLEAVQGEGGVNPAAPEFLEGVRALCDEKDILMICDEVQCGMGRTGKWFGWQHSKAAPDLVTMAKALADGVPAGALVANAKCADVFAKGSHASTFGGNPLACAAALAVISVIEEEKLLDAARVNGDILRGALEGFVEKYDKVLEVRGLGMMLGMAVDDSAAEIADLFRDFGLLVCTAGAHVVRFLPPLNLKESELEEALEMMTDALEERYGGGDGE